MATKHTDPVRRGKFSDCTSGWLRSDGQFFFKGAIHINEEFKIFPLSYRFKANGELILSNKGLSAAGKGRAETWKIVGKRKTGAIWLPVLGHVATYEDIWGWGSPIEVSYAIDNRAKKIYVDGPLGRITLPIP